MLKMWYVRWTILGVLSIYFCHSTLILPSPYQQKDMDLSWLDGHKMKYCDSVKCHILSKNSVKDDIQFVDEVLARDNFKEPESSFVSTIGTYGSDLDVNDPLILAMFTEKKVAEDDATKMITILSAISGTNPINSPQPTPDEVEVQGTYLRGAVSSDKATESLLQVEKDSSDSLEDVLQSNDKKKKTLSLAEFGKDVLKALQPLPTSSEIIEVIANTETSLSAVAGTKVMSPSKLIGMKVEQEANSYLTAAIDSAKLDKKNEYEMYDGNTDGRMEVLGNDISEFNYAQQSLESDKMPDDKFEKNDFEGLHSAPSEIRQAEEPEQLPAKNDVTFTKVMSPSKLVGMKIASNKATLPQPIHSTSSEKLDTPMTSDVDSVKLDEKNEDEISDGNTAGLTEVLGNDKAEVKYEQQSLDSDQMLHDKFEERAFEGLQSAPSEIRQAEEPEQLPAKKDETLTKIISPSKLVGMKIASSKATLPQPIHSISSGKIDTPMTSDGQIAEYPHTETIEVDNAEVSYEPTDHTTNASVNIVGLEEPDELQPENVETEIRPKVMSPSKLVELKIASNTATLPQPTHSIASSSGKLDTEKSYDKQDDKYVGTHEVDKIQNIGTLEVDKAQENSENQSLETFEKSDVGGLESEQIQADLEKKDEPRAKVMSPAKLVALQIESNNGNPQLVDTMNSMREDTENFLSESDIENNTLDGGLVSTSESTELKESGYAEVEINDQTSKVSVDDSFGEEQEDETIKKRIYYAATFESGTKKDMNVKIKTYGVSPEQMNHVQAKVELLAKQLVEKDEANALNPSASTISMFAVFDNQDTNVYWDWVFE